MQRMPPAHSPNKMYCWVKLIRFGQIFGKLD